MWLFGPFPHFIFFFNPEVDKSQIIIKLFILLPTLKSALFKQINLNAPKSADMVLSVENASGHGCFSHFGYRYVNHCSVFSLAFSDLASFFSCLLGVLSQFRKPHRRRCSINLGCQATLRYTRCTQCSAPWLLQAPFTFILL